MTQDSASQPQWGAMEAQLVLSRKAGGPKWTPRSTKNREKSIQTCCFWEVACRIDFLFFGVWSKMGWEFEEKSKKNRFPKRCKTKPRKLWTLHWRLGENHFFQIAACRNSLKKSVTKVMKNLFNQDRFGKCFFCFWSVLGTILASQVDQKTEKNDVKNKSDFKTMLEWRTPPIGPRDVVRQGSLAAPCMSRPISLRKQ